MSEAIIVRGGKAIDQSAALSSINNNINNLWDAINDINSKPSIPIYPDRCSILVTVLDSAGAVMKNAAVHCLDGTSWYYYTTNSSGQILFTTNSGSANIKAYGINSVGNYRWIDQVSVYSNVDAPSGTSKEVNMRLTLGTNISFQSISSNIYADDSMFYGNCRIRVANRCNVFICGAGGGGSGGLPDGGTGRGAGGGGITIVNNIVLNKNASYLFYIGTGGAGGHAGREYDNGSIKQPGGIKTGGTSTAFGYSATGGGFTAGTGNYNGGHPNMDSEYSNWGGGGARGGTIATNGGMPYGGEGGGRHEDGGRGSNGGGGGGAGAGGGTWGQEGGDGGPGKLTFYFS